jgi:hypothetical protein
MAHANEDLLRRGDEAFGSGDIWRLADGQATERWTYAEDQAAFDRFFGWSPGCVSSQA